MLDAKAMMTKAHGYRVTFEERKDGMLCSDFFPERGEPPIAELDEAWELAEKWAKVDPDRFVNIYVINGLNWSPVPDYQRRMFNSYCR